MPRVQIGGDLAENVFESTVGSVAHIARRQMGVARRVAEEVMTWPSDPSRAASTLEDLVNGVKSTVGAALGSGDEVRGGSPLWANRSRHRHFEAVRVPLDELKAASKKVDATINDLFLAAMVEGAVRYHGDRDVEVDAFNTSFVLSTRTDNAIGGNSFTPVPVQVPGEPMPLEDRIADISAKLTAKREGMTGGAGLGALSGVANLLADVGGHPGGAGPCSPDGFRHFEPARCLVPAVRVGGDGARRVVDGSGRRHRLQRNRDVLQRPVLGRPVHRPGGDRGTRGLPRRDRRVVRRHHRPLTGGGLTPSGPAPGLAM